MKTYIYKFIDGTKSIVEVDDNLYELLVQMDREEYNGWQRDNRRHVSMSELQENGIEIEDAEAELFRIFSKRESDEKLHNALSTLTEEQRELLYKIYVDKIPQVKIAEQTGITPRALNNRLIRILRKLKKLLQ